MLNNVITVIVVVMLPAHISGGFYNSNPWLWFPRSWYPTGAVLIINSLVGDLFVIGVLIDCVRPPDLLLKFILAPRAKTQGRMNELYSIPADITLALRTQLLALRAHCSAESHVRREHAPEINRNFRCDLKLEKCCMCCACVAPCRINRRLSCNGHNVGYNSRLHLKLASLMRFGQAHPVVSSRSVSLAERLARI